MLVFDGEVVSASHTERILGVYVSRTLFSWTDHIDKLLRDLCRTMNGLRKGATYLTFKQRLATAKSCYFAKLYYAIEVWGHGLTRAQHTALQSAQNKVLRWVTATPPRTSSQANIEACGVLSVRQMVIFRTLTVGMRILRDKKPVNLYSSLTRNYDIGELRTQNKGYYEQRFWRNVFLETFSRLPAEMQDDLDVKKRMTKIALQGWVKENVPLFYGV